MAADACPRCKHILSTHSLSFGHWAFCTVFWSKIQTDVASLLTPWVKNTHKCGDAVCCRCVQNQLTTHCMARSLLL